MNYHYLTSPRKFWFFKHTAYFHALGPHKSEELVPKYKVTGLPMSSTTVVLNTFITMAASETDNCAEMEGKTYLCSNGSL